MNHQDAIRESSLAKYILGELSGKPRDTFEEHLFECEVCAEDLKSGVTFLEVSRDELPAIARQRAEKPAGWFAGLLSPWWLVPALAASLMVTLYETAVVLPRERAEVAQAETPAILNSVVLGAGASRAEGVRQTSAPQGGSFQIVFDIPAQSDFTGYRCSLYSPSGSLVWQGAVTPQQAKDSVTVWIPTRATNAGLNSLRVEGLRPDGSAGDKFVELTKYQFLLQIK